ncbi:hypothetical protein [Streptomyces sp. 5-10]|uniref:hypothetical protein n=1 Tax=Streptomyces sp. 5-10 TaxID=878925 RepID=UPI00168A9FE2|nr:hypothetical protein [Streptomyces sp. 5-10]MBD3004860.1 hypothetical protein [Streptomyces sp. 5-10]
MTSKDRSSVRSLVGGSVVLALVVSRPAIADQMASFLPGWEWWIFCQTLTTCLIIFIGVEVVPEVLRVKRRKLDGSHEGIPS